MDTNPVDGGCLCGDVRYQLAGKVTRGGLCHCGNCRRAGGAPSVAWVLVAPGGLAFTHGEPTIYAYTRGDGVPTRRGFCGRCGTQLTYGSDGDSDIGITTGSLDDPERFPPDGVIWEDEKLSWVGG
ncbi:GFA family protein [Candidatus Poribacteria bacterium]|jgi:hypothetical protein|nr:GFA family protein [Candidatus Poribacteria bacterium]MBT5533149.1 GFA family protein [Candidatus Poribacteria bacterium]MBT5713858.1 GFA family protein [Candidatus Poribacteria bacterium]MBT7095805.1 GFA family protein [Candidatus Poribacteria bacterium]MBT7806419.1 GFA family protein [Candidatus Poribacteria bacterium]